MERSDSVRAGQLLARLDPTPLRDAMLQAEAQLAQARAQASNAATKLSRARQAQQAGVAAQQEVDDAALQDESAPAATLQTEDEAESGLSEPEWSAEMQVGAEPEMTAEPAPPEPSQPRPPP